jgi:hypothetical protein
MRCLQPLLACLFWQLCAVHRQLLWLKHAALLLLLMQEPCFRLPQLRYSKRRPGKCRWVLYEMWGVDDPVTGLPALLVTEQNITQVSCSRN